MYLLFQKLKRLIAFGFERCLVRNASRRESNSRLRRWASVWILCLFGVGVFFTSNAYAQSGLKIGFEGMEGSQDYGVAIQLLFVMTLLTLAPSMIILMTCFTRIIIVLGFVRSALGVQSAPSNQIIVGLALFLTFFLMAPVWERVYSDAIAPYTEKTITSKQALDISSTHMKAFMLRQTRDNDIEFFLGLSGIGPTKRDGLPLRIVVPSFILSELRTAFQMGFLIFIPFLIIDFLVASTLMSMGMMMMPPAVISLPFKLLLFVLVDGWYLIIRSLVESFSI